MPKTTITAKPDGPYLVAGEEIELIDPQGNVVPLKGGVFELCRCGHSGNKPFCDGTHRKIGFKASEAAKTE